MIRGINYPVISMLIQRDIHDKVQQLSKKFPVVTITGARQAGKTTLAKMAFPGYNYCIGRSEKFFHAISCTCHHR